MPPLTKIDDATIFIIDVGKNTGSSEDKLENNFFKDAKQCMSRIIERKIISQGKNLIGIILLGSKNTKNNMAEQCDGSFKNIEILKDLQSPTWQMIRELPETTSKRKGDWFDALIVAADHFQNGVSGFKMNNMKIILMTNFLYPTYAEEDSIEQVINGFKEEKYEVDIIGLDLFDDNLKGDDIDIARRLVEATGGATATFEDAMRYLLFHKKKVVNAMPWNVDLSIGPDIKIPVSTYIRMKDEPVIKNWSKAVKDTVTNTASSSEAVMKTKVHINPEDQTVVEPEQVIKGYHYGQQIIPFNDCDKTMLYSPGEKSLSVYGFTNAKNITWQNLSGDGLSYVFGRKGDPKAQFAIKCLVECLHELDLVGIVRRVYNNGNAPKMYALMPVIDTNNFICLSMMEICYKEDIKNMAFPDTNLKKYACSDVQVNAFKDLITSMDLTKAYDDSYEDTEAFPIAQTVSPSAQYIMDCIAYRAMNPGKPLPQPRDDIMMLFKVPSLIAKQSKDKLEKLKTLFVLEKVEPKTRGKRNNQLNQNNNKTYLKQDGDPTANNQNDFNFVMPKVKLPKMNKSENVERIGTVDPINDFQILVKNGKSLDDLFPQMAEAIESLTYCNLDGKYSKALSAMSYIRSESIKCDPIHYNKWLQKFKFELTDRKKSEIMNLIVERKLNFIVKDENSSSTYDSENSHDDSQTYENDTIPNSTELSIRC